MGLEVAHGGGLVLVHEPAVARDIGGKNGGEPALCRGLRVPREGISRGNGAP
jgi:hypothetical protein